MIRSTETALTFFLKINMHTSAIFYVGAEAGRRLNATLHEMSQL